MKNKEIDNDYKLIPMKDIDDEAREIAVRWAEGNGYDWIGDKHKLASDIMNYARRKANIFSSNAVLSDSLPTEQYPDKEADGIVFCGKCGAKK